MKNFMPPLPPSSTKNTFVGVIKHDLQKASNNTIKFMPSAKALSTTPDKQLPLRLSERNVIYARKLSYNFASKYGKFLQDLNSRLAAGSPSPIKKLLVATPAPSPVTLSTFIIGFSNTGNTAIIIKIERVFIPPGITTFVSPLR
ncbi:MAG: hypothetical protein ACR5LC_14250 [Symbiopectobacterium sp.]